MILKYYSDGTRVYRKLWDGPSRNEDCAVVFYARSNEQARKVAEECNKSQQDPQELRDAPNDSQDHHRDS